MQASSHSFIAGPFPSACKHKYKETSIYIFIYKIHIQHMGLVMVSAFTRGSMLKGFIGVSIGLLIGAVGMDRTDAIERFTFGSIDLLSGVPFAAALVGLFGFAVVISDLSLIRNYWFCRSNFHGPVKHMHKRSGFTSGNLIILTQGTRPLVSCQWVAKMVGT